MAPYAEHMTDMTRATVHAHTAEEATAAAVGVELDKSRIDVSMTLLGELVESNAKLVETLQDRLEQVLSPRIVGMDGEKLLDSIEPSPLAGRIDHIARWVETTNRSILQILERIEL